MAILNQDLVTEYVFGEKMRGCPNCTKWRLKIQMPTKLENGQIMMQGPAFIQCLDCGHAAPSIDCTGIAFVDVAENEKILAGLRYLWNNQ